MAGLDHQPPPFFKQGPAPLALLSFYLALSIALFVTDLRFHTLEWMRQSIMLVIDPAQRLMQTPVVMLADTHERFAGMQRLQDENEKLKHDQLATAPNLLRLSQLETENARLRELLGVKEREKVNGQVAEILYSARDPFSRRVVVDKGDGQGIVAGQPVIDNAGVVGQVTRVFPMSAEVTLITDKNQAVPVQVVRNGLRSVLFGLGNGQLELRYLPANADVQEGDILVTSGLDGIYLSGFPVAKVVAIERDSAYSFARIFSAPLAAVENFGEVMILNPRKALPERPPEAVSQPGEDSDKPGAPRPKKKRVPKKSGA
ncbi:MAG: hypothetical protein RIR00_2464 [Pseudomonadota bacterium]|jgi:rod shape-determining protein MreC